jgi:competence protein ComEA
VRVARAVGERPAVPAAAERAVAAQQAAIDRAAQRRDSTRRERERRRSRGWGEARRAEEEAKAGRPRARRAPATGGLPDRPVDVDVATAAELERLPRVGPALAARIVADRDSLGAFGSLGGLERVRGVGPAMLEALAPHVTFSGTPRPRDDPPHLSRPARSRRPAGRPSARTRRVPPVAAAPPRALSSRSRAPPSWPSRQPPPPSASATC